MLTSLKKISVICYNLKTLNYLYIPIISIKIKIICNTIKWLDRLTVSVRLNANITKHRHISVSFTESSIWTVLIL